eukprot:TRINITY_DN13113_c0_g1_i1.p1 TRINITY_DN13113_c0_g1~~TRINITY_DN13113_c0_g1_i1.p1  ORF type:complete len:606 (-),score=109.72 TRINITY_DN13113_c0_g1_i1:137-1954(-)
MHDCDAVADGQDGSTESSAPDRSCDALKSLLEAHWSKYEPRLAEIVERAVQRALSKAEPLPVAPLAASSTPTSASTALRAGISMARQVSESSCPAGFARSPRSPRNPWSRSPRNRKVVPSPAGHAGQKAGKSDKRSEDRSSFKDEHELAVTEIKTLSKTYSHILPSVHWRDEKKKRNSLGHLIHSAAFDFVSAGVIVLSCMFLAWQTEVLAQNPLEPLPLGLFVVEVVFTILFTLELVLRFAADGLKLFCIPGWRWVILDVVVVSSSLLEILISSTIKLNASVLRLLRILRIVRTTRLLRALKSLGNLRVMVSGILGCVVSLAMAVVLLLSMIFVFAVCITQIVSAELAKDRAVLLERFTEEDIDSLNACYGSLFRAIYSLFKSITGGVSWGEMSDPLLKVSPALCLLFCFYIVFAVLAVLNILTGIFNENAIKMKDNDAELIIMEKAKALKARIQGAKTAFGVMDSDHSGLLDWDEFKRNLHNDSLQAYFKHVELEVDGVDTAKKLFTMLDFDDSGYIDVDEFIFGVARLKGYARALDVARLTHLQKGQYETLVSLGEDVSNLNARIESLTRLCSERFLRATTADAANAGEAEFLPGAVPGTED